MSEVYLYDARTGLRVAIIPEGRRASLCGICGRQLDAAEDPRSENCGGDCLACMAEAGDPDCLDAVREIEAHERDGA